MRVQLVTASLLAAAGLLASAASSQAGDVIRLSIPVGDSTPTLKLGEISPNADTLDVWHGGGFHGGFHGGFGGFHRGFGGFHGGFGGFRGGYLGGFRGYYGGYRGFAGGYYGYRPYYGYGYGYPQVYYGYYPYYYPIGTVTPPITTTFSLNLGPAALQIQGQPVPLPSNTLPPAGNPGTFQYDGGPRSPIPMPGANQPAPRPDPAPKNVQPSVPLEGRPVSILAVRPTPKYTYPAYGEQPRSSTDTTRQVKR